MNAKELFNDSKNNLMTLQLNDNVQKSKDCAIVNFKPVWTYTHEDKTYKSELELFEAGLAYFYTEVGHGKRYCIEINKNNVFYGVKKS